MSLEATLFDKLEGKLDSSSPAPLYIQLEQLLTDAIKQGHLAKGDTLPPERTIAEHLNISRVTVRKAIDSLERAGLCNRKRGAGTFVSGFVTGPTSVEQGTLLPQSLSTLHGFTEDMKSRGMNPDSQLIEKVITTPTAEEMFSLNLKQESVLRLTRIRLADDIPMALEICCIPSTIIPRKDLIDESIYAAMNSTKHSPVRAVQRISACILDKEQAAMLEVKENSPALYIRRAAYDDADRPVEYSRSYYRADRFDFVAELISRDAE